MLKRTREDRRDGSVRDVSITYGIGAQCGARFPDVEIAGLRARDLIGRVVATPQPPGPASRTAAVLAGALRAGRRIDIVLASNSAKDQPYGGVPISPDHVVVSAASGKTSATSQKSISLMVSEAYVGGA